MFKVNNKNTRKRCGVFIVNFEHISHLVLGFLLLTWSRWMSAGDVQDGFHGKHVFHWSMQLHGGKVRSRAKVDSLVLLVEINFLVLFSQTCYFWSSKYLRFLSKTHLDSNVTFSYWRKGWVEALSCSFTLTLENEASCWIINPSCYNNLIFRNQAH